MLCTTRSHRVVTLDALQRSSPKSHQRSCIRRRDLGTNHPSRPTDDLCVQLPPAMGAQWREPPRGEETPMGRSLPAALLPARPAKPPGGARYRHHLPQPARKRWLRHSAGCWQGNLLAWMANVRVTYRNRRAAFCFVCQPVHRHGREGGASTKQAVRPQKSHRAAQTGAGNTWLSCCRDIP